MRGPPAATIILVLLSPVTQHGHWRQLLPNPVVWSDVSAFARNVERLHRVETCSSRSTHLKSMARIDRPAKRRYDEGIDIPAVIARHCSKICGLYLGTEATSDFDFTNIGMVDLKRLRMAHNTSQA